jgi:hypothetical protein
MTEDQAIASVDAAILKVVLPSAYDLIDQLVADHLAGRGPTKATVVAARKLLPSRYSTSFSNVGERHDH